MPKPLNINAKAKQKVTSEQVWVAVIGLNGTVIDRLDTLRLYLIEPPVKTPRFLTQLKQTGLFEWVKRARFYKPADEI